MLKEFIKGGIAALPLEMNRKLTSDELETYTEFFYNLLEDGAVDEAFWLEIIKDAPRFIDWTTILTPSDVIWYDKCQTFQDLVNLKEEEGSLIFEYEDKIIVHI